MGGHRTPLANAIRTARQGRSIICGKQAIDGRYRQVVRALRNAGHSVVAWVRKVEDVSETQIRVERMMEDGYEVVDMPLPGFDCVKESTCAHGVAQRENAREENRGCYNNAEALKAADKEKIGLKEAPRRCCVRCSAAEDGR